MSATGRGSERRESDFYPTPMNAFLPMLRYIRERGRGVWEPACGDDRLINAMIEYGLQSSGDDIKNGYDFLADSKIRDCIVTNPPYSLAFEFCQHAVEVADHVYLLLRLNFLASKKRREWFSRNEPSALFVLSERPSFTGRGTDAIDYAWFYWGTDHLGIFHI